MYAHWLRSISLYKFGAHWCIKFNCCKNNNNQCCSFISLVNRCCCLWFYCSGLDIDKLQQVVKTRWLKPQEVLKILQNHELFTISHKPPQKPQSNKCILWFSTVNIWSKLALDCFSPECESTCQFKTCRWFLVSFQSQSTPVLQKWWIRMAKEKEWEDH